MCPCPDSQGADGICWTGRRCSPHLPFTVQMAKLLVEELLNRGALLPGILRQTLTNLTLPFNASLEMAASQGFAHMKMNHSHT